MALIDKTGGSNTYTIARMLRLMDNINAVTISATATFNAKSGNLLSIDGGASDRYVDAVAGQGGAEQEGMWYLFKNAGATNNITLRDSAAATITTLVPGSFALIAYTGAAWVAFNPATVAAAAATLAPTSITLTDNTAAALDIKEGSNVYLRFVTTNSGEKVTVGKPLLMAGGLDAATFFKSTEITGTGSAQNTAHGLSSTPSLVWASVTEDPAGSGFDVAEGTHDSTDCVFTVTSGVKYKVYALK